MTSSRRVVVTGLGVKTPAGCDLTSFWTTLMLGESVAAPIALFDASDLPVTFACEITNFDPSQYFGIKEQNRLDRVSIFGVAAGLDAVEDAGGPMRSDPSRRGVVFGTGTGGTATLLSDFEVFQRRGATKLSPFAVPRFMPNASAALLAIRLGWTGPNFTVATACASSAHAIGEATRLIRTGACDVALAGGSESGTTPFAISAFAQAGALSKRNDSPALASRPFDIDRDGYVMSEGGACLVLESREHAVDRNARVYAEVAGFGSNCDAFHITAPSPGGLGAAACLDLALADAGLTPDEIGHINAHGTSTLLNDANEGEAIANVFGARRIPVTSSKGVFGHLMGGAGAAEAVATILSMINGTVPPTANHQKTDPAIELDVVAGSVRHVSQDPAISNSFGFGGHNACLVFAPV